MHKNGSYFGFPGYYVNASPASCKLIKQFTEGESCITALDVDIDGRVVVVGDINGEIHGYLTGLATNSIYFCFLFCENSLILQKRRIIKHISFFS